MSTGTPLNANQYIEVQLDDLLKKLEDKFDKDGFAFVGPLMYSTDDFVRDLIESRPTKRNALLVVLETTGGYIEPARRMVSVFRHHYSANVEFVVPSYAMSAGTVLAMSGDAIHMDYYATLGPIDPQVESKDGNLIPALGYLVQYNKLLGKANAGAASSAEIALLMKFDQAELHKYEQEAQLSVTLLKEWLAKYKFKDWKKTETKKTDVTPQMKEERAAEIANALNDTERWHTHGRGITMEVLRRDLKLVIDDFGQDAALDGMIRHYHRLLIDYMRRLDKNWMIHRPGKFLYF